MLLSHSHPHVWPHQCIILQNRRFVFVSPTFTSKKKKSLYLPPDWSTTWFKQKAAHQLRDRSTGVKTDLHGTSRECGVCVCVCVFGVGGLENRRNETVLIVACWPAVEPLSELKMNRKLGDPPSWTSPGPPSSYPHTRHKSTHMHKHHPQTRHALILLAGTLTLPFSLWILLHANAQSSHTHAHLQVWRTHTTENVFAESINSSSDVAEVVF